MRYFGIKGLQERIRAHLAIAEDFARWVDVSPHLERIAPVPLSTVCFRARAPRGGSTKAANRLNAAWLLAINADRKFYLSHSKINGVYFIRVALNHLRLASRHVEELQQHLDATLAPTLAAHTDAHTL